MDPIPTQATPEPPGGRATRAYLADSALIGVTLIWGSTFVMVKVALADVTPFEFLALRFGLAFVALAIIVRRRLPGLSGAELRAGLVIGVFLFVGYATQTTGLQFTTASQAGFITGLSVLLVPVLGLIVLRQRIGWGVLLGVALATVGLWLISVAGSVSFGLGELLLLACAIAFAAHILAIGSFAPRYDPLRLAVVQVGVVALLAGVTTVAVEHPTLRLPSDVWLAVAFTGLIGSAVVLGVQTVAQRETSPTHAALIFSLEPVFAALFAYLISGERLGSSGFLGGGLILAGMVLAELKRA